MDTETEAAIRREIQKQLSNTGPVSNNSEEYRAEHWDFYITRIEDYPGPGWIFHAFAGLHNAVAFIVWRMSRVEQAKLGIKSKMPLI